MMAAALADEHRESSAFEGVARLCAAPELIPGILTLNGRPVRRGHILSAANEGFIFESTNAELVLSTDHPPLAPGLRYELRVLTRSGHLSPPVPVAAVSERSEVFRDRVGLGALADSTVCEALRRHFDLTSG